MSFLGLLVLFGAGFFFSCSNSDATQVYTYSVVNTYPHDSNAFTQGLVFEDGALFEGTGLYGSST
ncbi:MAG: glutaminyl-peptide cyclotransferase, partial [Dehalococcoidia bacterium]|nr:glutaminyl-peptide cyclotransferase [Dehalococcoidia bacterium]